MDKQQLQRESFVVRIWRQPGWGDWQVWVQHVRSGQSAALHNLDELRPFIERWSATPEGPGKRGLK